MDFPRTKFCRACADILWEVVDGGIRGIKVMLGTMAGTRWLNKMDVQKAFLHALITASTEVEAGNANLITGKNQFSKPHELNSDSCLIKVEWKFAN